MNLKPKTNHQQGYLMIMVMMLVTVISIFSLTLFRICSRDNDRLIRNYLEMNAQYAAESGIELAKNEILTSKVISKVGSGKTPMILNYGYGPDLFTSLYGKTINCHVTVYLHRNNVYIESKASVEAIKDAGKDSAAVIVRKVRKVFKISGSSLTFAE